MCTEKGEGKKEEGTGQAAPDAPHAGDRGRDQACLRGIPRAHHDDSDEDEDGAHLSAVTAFLVRAPRDPMRPGLFPPGQTGKLRHEGLSHTPQVIEQESGQSGTPRPAGGSRGRLS